MKSLPIRFLLFAQASAWSPVFIYGMTALVVLWGMLLPGYILTLDMVFAPSMDLSDLFYGLEGPWVSDMPLLFLLKAASYILPMWVVQKVVLFLILVLSGLFAFNLCPAANKVGRYFAGFIYMLNPFVYVRMMAGQWKILLAYAFLPLAVKVMVDFFETPSLRNALKVGLLLVVVGVLNIAVAFLAVLVLVIFFVIKVFQMKGSLAQVKQMVEGMAVIALVSVLTSLYWIVPVLTSQENLLTQIGSKDLLVFSSKTWGTGFNAIFSIASMHGFWRAGYEYISDILPRWYLVFFLILFLVVLGAVLKWNDRKIGPYVKGLAFAGVLSVVLGTGISTRYFSDLYEFLFDHLFFFRGMRDSQRFVALLAVAYSYLGGLAVGEIFESWRGTSIETLLNRRRAILGVLLVIALISPLLYGLNMFGGFNGRLKPIDYPKDWYQANRYLNQQEGDFNVLFLPWHGYLRFPWVGRTLANPSAEFFDSPVIRGENIEVFSIETQSTSPVQHYVGFLLDRKDEIKRLGALLVPLNVKYIVLVKGETDTTEFLLRQGDLHSVLESDTLVVFRNENPVAKFYYTNGAGSLGGLGELVRLVEGGASTDRLFILGEETLLEGEDSDTLMPIDYKRASPVKYTLSVPEEGYVVTTITYSEEWRADGEILTSNLGITNAFTTSKGEVGFYFQRFTLMLVFYMVSLVSLLLILLGLLMAWIRPIRRGRGEQSR